MNDNVIRLVPPTAKPEPMMALFFTIDAPPRIAVTLCTQDTLFDSVKACLFGAGDAASPEQRREISDVVLNLLERGASDFEDGFLVLCRGLAASIEYLMLRNQALYEQELETDRLRYGEMVARQAAEKKYTDLQAALIEALAEKAPAIVTLAAADIIAQGGKLG